MPASAQAPCLIPEHRIEVNRRFVRTGGATNLTDLLTRFISAQRLGVDVIRPEDTPLVVMDGC